MSDYSYFSYKKVGHRYSISSSTGLSQYIMLRELHKCHAELDENDPDLKVQQLVQEKKEFIAARKRKDKKQKERNRIINNENLMIFGTESENETSTSNSSPVPNEQQLQLAKYQVVQSQCLLLPPPPPFRPPPPPYIGLIHPLAQIPFSQYMTPCISILWIGKFANVIGASFIGHPPGTISIEMDKVMTVAALTCGPVAVQTVAAVFDAPSVAPVTDTYSTNNNNDCKPSTSTTSVVATTTTTIFSNFAIKFFAKDGNQNNADKKKKKQQKVKGIPIATIASKVQDVKQ